MTQAAATIDPASNRPSRPRREDGPREAGVGDTGIDVGDSILPTFYSGGYGIGVARSITSQSCRSIAARIARGVRPSCCICMCITARVTFEPASGDEEQGECDGGKGVQPATCCPGMMRYSNGAGYCDGWLPH